MESIKVKMNSITLNVDITASGFHKDSNSLVFVIQIKVKILRLIRFIIT